MKNNQQGFLNIVLLVVLAIVLIGGGTYLVTRNKTPDSGQAPKGTADGSRKPTPTASEWKTYTNDQYNFSFKYPGNLKTPTFSADHTSLSVGASGVYVYLPKVFLDTKGKAQSFAAVTNSYKTTGNTIGTVVVGGVQGISVTGPKIGRRIFVPLSNNHILQIDTTADNSLVDQLLPTFKFTQ